VGERKLVEPIYRVSHIAVLIMLSIVLTASVLYPQITGEQIPRILGGGTTLGLMTLLAPAALRRSSGKPIVKGATDSSIHSPVTGSAK
jgi:hypothetical protein